ncbi:MAG TPA: hypothetical protein PL151_05985 [Phycisphaerae bacterium]|nr:hypothetical protein [Phycisphaerae bacterium]HOJ74621.1 hypothetical protein [Phycisphaerae bacterium]HOM50520.1 hypothetical protein [Phycisphaerae bacterium]HON68791.1 hypothetical protein [Phycisphaerae bacterium]HOQ87518.1 hypothetical protein [Phycisphaerae bacterium]
MPTGEPQANSQEFVTDWFQKTAELTEATLRATAQMQMAGLEQWMDTMFGARQREWQKIPERMLERIPAAQRSAREYMQALEETYRQGLSLFDEWFKPEHNKNRGEIQEEARKNWKELMDRIRTSSQTFMQANAKAIDAWASAFQSKEASPTGG